MFITNNHDSFHLWWEKNLVEHQKVWKYYDQDCSSVITILAITGASEEPCVHCLFIDELYYWMKTRFLCEWLLGCVLIAWSLYICVSIALTVFLMGTLVNNDSTLKDTYLYPFTNKLDGIYWMLLTALNESLKVNSLFVNEHNWARYLPTR